ncbi:MAG: response regulator [Acidobacteria bacterium]|nr:response regulator [Acidobacteriota bacterium]
MASVLVVEDDAPVRSLIRIVLEGEGHGVREAAGGVAALDEVARAMPDVVLLDLMMPGMDGWRFLTELHERGLRERTRVIIVSARADSGSVARGRREGALAYLPKPFTPEALLRAVDEAMLEPPADLLRRRQRVGELVRLIRILEQTVSR